MTPTTDHPTMLDDYRLYQSRKHFQSLDGIRALSILAVVWHHAGIVIAGPSVANLGFLGVDMFFVLSGFLIVTLLLRERDRRGRISLRDFYVRRGLRIFPLYYGILAGLMLVAWLMPGSGAGSAFLAHLPFLLTYTSNWVPLHSIMGIAWSLATEEQFYLVWPPIEKWLSRRVCAILVGFLLVNQAVNFLMVDNRLAKWLSVSNLPNIYQITFTPILLGVALAHILHARRGFELLARMLRARWSPIAVLGLLGLLLAAAPAQITGWPRLGIQLLMALFLGSCVIREPHALTPVLEWSPIRRIGVVSYGIYLYHILVLDPVVRVAARVPVSLPGGRFVATFLLAWGVSELSYRYYEKPFLRLKEKLGRLDTSVDPRSAPVGGGPEGEVVLANS